MSNITEKENFLLCLEGKQPEWIPSYFDANAFLFSAAATRKIDAKGRDMDIYGIEFVATPDGALPENTKSGNFLLKDITKWKDVMPNINWANYDWEAEARMHNAKINRDHQLVNSVSGYIWEQLHYMMGVENALLSLVIEPEAAYDCLNAMADIVIEALRYQHKHLKPDMVILMEHIATLRGPLMSPRTYREIIKPVHKKVCDAIIELGAMPIMHCDGYIEELIPDYVEIGCKMIKPLQPCNDINLYKEKYGLLAIGGWNAFGRGNQADTTEEEARASVRLAMDTYGPGGRYCFWQSGLTPRYNKIAEWIADEARVYGKPFYKQ